MRDCSARAWRIDWRIHHTAYEINLNRGFVELLGSLDKPQIALVDQVGKAQSLVLVLFGYGDHEAQVGFGQFLQGFLVSLLDSLGEFHLLFDRDELLLADLLQVLVQRSALAVGDGLGNL